MASWRPTVGVCTLGAIVAVGACLPGSGPPLDIVVQDAGAPPPTSLGDDSSLRDDLSLGPPFAVGGLQPSHGPWSGGTRTTISGRGFSSNIEVWFGSTQLPSSAIFASDPTQAAVTTPPGAPGPVDVHVRNVETAEDAILPAGFVYDAFSVTPGTGSTTGGTRIALAGEGTSWTSASTVTIGGNPCTAVLVADATDMACTTPAASGPGSESVLVTNADGTTDEADDAFVYSDSPDGYRGGLYGGALSGTLNVLAFDAWTGVPLTGAQAIAGSSLATAVIGTIGSNGAVQLTGPSLSGTVTVTVAGPCHQPMTYVDVPVDTVTVYLPPTLSTACAGDPPSTGNYIPQDLGQIAGELVWNGGVEFQRSAWSNIPMPGPGERQAAYVFVATNSIGNGFQLPSPSSATTPASGGQLGYSYTLSAVPGNQTIYALAGLELDTDAGQVVRFEPYAMGVVTGVPVQPNVEVTEVDIPMTTLLNHTVTTVPQPPGPSPSGPDRLISQLGVDVGSGFFATLPQGSITTLLPISGDVSFVGVPTLDQTLANDQYALSAAAVTGANGNLPVSVVTGIETTDSNTPVTIGGFLQVPTLVQPPASTWNGTQVQIQATGPVDLAVVTVESGNGLVGWQIVAPGTDLSFQLPDISQVQGVDSLVHGPISTTFAIANINGFNYSQLPSGQLSSYSWSAYAEDQAQGSY
jgi:hypothetical protein